MNRKFIFKNSISKMTLPDFSRCLDASPVQEKQKISEYLKSFPLSAYTSEPVYDKFTGDMVREADNARSDGVYTWYESEIYHFDKYNLKLDDEFVDYVLNKTA